MIRSFADKDTAALANGERVRRWINIESVARRKLAQLHAAATLDFIRVPPGNRLEALKGGRSGQHSIRINDQFLSGRMAMPSAWKLRITTEMR